MSDLSKESMKRLTKQIMQADLASRKNRMLTSKSLYFATLLIVQPTLYLFYQMFFPTGPILSVTAQGGNPHNFYLAALSSRILPMKAYFRPEIYYQDLLSNLDTEAEQLKEIIEKNENVKFNAYVWH